jgi:AmiR/NasT family two-component response regulator
LWVTVTGMTQPDVRPLCILAADENASRLEELAATLRALGHDVTPFAVSTDDVAEIIEESDPDVAIVALHDDDDHALELIEEIGSRASGPVLAALEVEDAEFVSRAAARGIFAYARPVTAEAVQSAIEVAVHRHADMAALSGEVDRLESALERRAYIEQAKGILMERHGIDDQAAFEMLRKRARETNRRVIDLARQVIEVRGL